MKGVHMKTMISMLGPVVLLSGFTLVGCYTQVSSTRDDMFSEEYANQETETSAVSDDSTGDTGEYFDENGLPRERYYFDSYYPAVSVGFGWYDPYWYGYGSWWGYGGWYGGWGGYYPPYCGYYPPYYCYYPSYSYYDGYGVTRRTGSTRGSGDHRTVGGVRGGTVEPTRGGGAATGVAVASTDLPTGRKNISDSRTTKATKPRTSAARTTTSRSGDGARKEGVKKTTGSTRSGSSKSSGQVRQPRRPGKTKESGSEQQTRGSSSQPSVRSSAHSAPSSPPASSGARGGAPSGGTSGGGGGGARGGGRR